ncbi:MAG: type IX secretion system membrane protein PorP/SprF [Bacteroidetes bacterium]|nr:MAG: type IX secretion system membrane protein PorP/SprF [Bacteroidota bacterium]MBL1144834.1 type IX secretion system membrane protein PorP/SprF [Bacteroidota bacterium]MCB0803198.1 PorP/SprF family type IX secretion system membrane protein [Flavobacteriales bacterium]
MQDNKKNSFNNRKMKKIKGLIFIVAIMLNGVVDAQELSHGYYNYIMNRFNLNPAFAGNSGNVSAIMNTKTYAAGFNDAPRNTMFGIHTPINNVQGIGARIISDKRGAYEVSKYDATYSYQVRFADNSDLRFGISAGALRRMMNPNSISNLEYLDQTDPTLAGNYFDETNFIAGVGLVYDYNQFQFGLSAPSLVVGGEDLSEHIVGTASYKYKLENSDFNIIPTLIYQNMPVIDNRYDILLKGEYQEKVWAQVGYQSTQNLNFGIGFDLGPFGIGYSYEMNNSAFSNISKNSNEIVVRMSFLPAKQKERNETTKMLDEYVAKFNAMIKDTQNTYSKSAVFSEIQNIRKELDALAKQNDKKKAKAVKKRLIVIENQITELEKKYK